MWEIQAFYDKILQNQDNCCSTEETAGTAKIISGYSKGSC